MSEDTRPPLDQIAPETREGIDMLDHSVQYVPADAGRAVVASKIAAIEAEARAAERERLRVVVEGLPIAPMGRPGMSTEWVRRHQVLRLLSDDHAEPTHE